MKHSMVSAVTLLVVCLLGLATATPWGYSCYTYSDSNNYFYNLNDLSTSDSTKYSVTIGNFMPTDGTAGPVTANIIFNICGTRDKPQGQSGCNNGQNSVGYIWYGNECYALSREAGSQNTIWSQGSYNGDNSTDGISIFANNEEAKTENAVYNVTFAFKCDSTVTGNPGITASQDSSQNIVLNIVHEKACHVNLGPFNLKDWKWPVLFLGAIIGAIMCIMGIRAFKYCLAFIGFIIGFVVPFLLLSIAWKDVDNSNKIYFILAVSFLLACMACYFVYMLRDVGFFIAGCFLGIVIALECYVIFVHKWEKSGSSLLLYLTCGGMALIIGSLAMWIKDYILIFTTSIGGSYLFIKCIGCMIGNYPDEFAMTKEIEYGKLDTVPTIFYVYLGVTCLFALAGLVYQCKLLKEIKENEELEKNYRKA